MEIPPEFEAQISQKQQYAWDTGLIQGFIWYVNNVMCKTGQFGNGEIVIGDQRCLISLKSSRSFDDEYYVGSLQLFGEAKQPLFELLVESHSYGSWFTRGASAQGAVNAFIDGPWVEQFLSYLSALKADREMKAEQARKAADQKSVEDLKSRFGLS